MYKIISAIQLLLFLVHGFKLTSQSCPIGSITLDKQSVIDSFVIKYPDCSELNFPIRIFGSGINNFSGLRNLRRINSNLVLENLPDLTSLAGLDSVLILNSLRINNVPELVSLSALSNVKEIDFVRIENNLRLQGFDGIDLKSKDIFIHNNASLYEINGIHTPDTATNIRITSNPRLNWIRNFENLKVLTGTLNLSDNQAVRHLDNFNYLVRINGSLIIEDIDSTEYLPDFDSLQYVGTDIRISGNNTGSFINKTKNIPLFPNLIYVGREIKLRLLINSEVGEYSGFNNLESVRDITFNLNACTHLSAFNKLTDVPGRINIDGHYNMYDINGFKNLQTAGEIYVKANVELAKFTGFSKLKRVEKDIILQSASINLESFEGLAQLEYVGKGFKLNLNRNLRSLGLKNLKYVGGDFWLQDSDRLKNLDELSTLTTVLGELYIFHNDHLEDITGLSNIDYSGVTTIDFRAHPRTTFCAIKLFCDYLTEKPDSPFKVGGNGTGCNTREEILEQCRLVSTTDMHESEDIVIFPNPAATEIYIKVASGSNVRDIRVYNLSGQLIHYDRVQNGRLDISRLSSGVYIAGIQTDEGNVVQKKLVVL